MGWLDYYRLLERYGGDLSKADPAELTRAAHCNPNDPVSALEVARRKWDEDQERLARQAGGEAVTE